MEIHNTYAIPLIFCKNNGSTRDIKGILKDIKGIFEFI